MPGKKKRLEDAYRFPGFRPSRWVCGVFGDPQVRIMVLEREQKKLLAAFAVESTGHFTIARDGRYEIFLAGIRACISMWSSGEWRAAVAVL
jgi:hypothetical protein